MKVNHAAANSDEEADGATVATSMINTTITSTAEEAKQAAAKPAMNA